jgi:group I intron endonuclease
VQIYLVTNLINEKYYVGKTKKLNLRKYLQDAQSMARHGFDNRPLLHRAFRKYGDAAFIIEHLAACATNEQAIELERAWIAALDSRNPEIGYNLTSGGEGSPDCKHSAEVRARWSQQRKGRPSWNTGKKCPQLGISRFGADNPFFGKTHTEEVRKIISQSNKGRIPTPEMRAQMSLIKTGFVHSEDSIKKMVDIAKSRPRDARGCFC